MNRNLEDILIIVKLFSGSTMDIRDIHNQYLGLTPVKKHYLYKETKFKVRDLDKVLNLYEDNKEHAFNINFEAILGLLSVDMNLIALDNDTKDIKLDPATVLLCMLDDKNKKL